MIWKWIGQAAQGVLVLGSALVLGFFGVVFVLIMGLKTPAFNHIGLVPLGFVVGAVVGFLLSTVVLGGFRSGVGRLVRWRNASSERCNGD